MKVKGLIGTIFQARGGLWGYNLRQNGERFKFSLGVKDKSDAIAAAREEEAKLIGKKNSRRVMFYDFMDEYRKHTLTRKGPGTLENERYMNQIIMSLIPNQVMRDFEPKKADTFFDDLAARERKDHYGNIVPNRITGHGKNLYLRYLRTLWNQAITWKMAEENPFLGVKPFDTATKIPRSLEESELKKLYVSIGKLHPQIADLVTFLLYTGMRRNEALTLGWDNVIMISGRKFIHLKKTKFNKERLVPVLDVIEDILESRKPLERPFSDMQRPSTISRQFLHVRRDAGIPHAKLHDLRKTFSTLLAGQNISTSTISKWIGHSTTAVTDTFYIGLDQPTMKKVNRTMNKVHDKSKIIRLNPENNADQNADQMQTKRGNKKQRKAS